uniref:Uncharacterized protein n=1 Tax=Arundo donax TaxID=35708 RepID=A0A0A9H826_ARUDO
MVFWITLFCYPWVSCFLNLVLVSSVRTVFKLGTCIQCQNSSL